MSKCRIIGAGNAGSTVYSCNVNLNTAGGNKKQGLPWSVDTQIINYPVIATRAIGNKRNVIFTMNQLGGVSSSSFRSSVHGYAGGDGIHNKASYVFK